MMHFEYQSGLGKSGFSALANQAYIVKIHRNTSPGGLEMRYIRISRTKINQKTLFEDFSLT